MRPGLYLPPENCFGASKEYFCLSHHLCLFQLNLSTVYKYNYVINHGTCKSYRRAHTRTFYGSRIIHDGYHPGRMIRIFSHLQCSNARRRMHYVQASLYIEKISFVRPDRTHPHVSITSWHISIHVGTSTILLSTISYLMRTAPTRRAISPEYTPVA
jgi:hypothetical protein